MQASAVKIIECPRDAMQGWKHFIPTAIKVEYLEALLGVGFDTIDCGSFVSAKAIPQMIDTKEVLAAIDMGGSRSKLLAIVANTRGAEEASAFEVLAYLGFPFSISETFQLRNTNSSIEASLKTVEHLYDACLKTNKQPVIYISMAFGNPYGDPYAEDIVYEWVEKIASLGISIISLADTVGMASPGQVKQVTKALIKAFPALEIGVHLHSTHHNFKEKVEAAVSAGCGRFDGALLGIGGCPMANDSLVGNMDTEKMIRYFQSVGKAPPIDESALNRCIELASGVFV